jgi:predicted RNase H-like HicB family nuclease
MEMSGKNEYIEIEEKPMQIRVVIEFDPEVNGYSAYCPELPGCTSCGDSEQEAMGNIREAIALYLEPDEIGLTPDVKVYEVVI